MKKAMDEVQKCTVSQSVNNVLNTQNRLSTAFLNNISINSLLLIYWEGNVGQSGELKEPYNLLSIQGKSVIIELPHGPTKFRNVSIKPTLLGVYPLTTNSLSILC